MFEKILPYLASGLGGFAIRDAMSGFVKEWIKEFWTDIRRRKKLRYSIGRKILNLITEDTLNLSKEPPIDEIVRLKQHAYGHNKKVSVQLMIYGRVRRMLQEEILRLTKERSVKLTSEDLKMIDGFNEELSIMTQGLTIQAHYLMGNSKLDYWWKMVQFLIKKRWIIEKVRREMGDKKLSDLIERSKESVI